jgi:hypothetical protein
MDANLMAQAKAKLERNEFFRWEPWGITALNTAEAPRFWVSGVSGGFRFLGFTEFIVIHTSGTAEFQHGT